MYRKKGWNVHILVIWEFRENYTFMRVIRDLTEVQPRTQFAWSSREEEACPEVQSRGQTRAKLRRKSREVRRSQRMKVRRNFARKARVWLKEQLAWRSEENQVARRNSSLNKNLILISRSLKRRGGPTNSELDMLLVSWTTLYCTRQWHNSRREINSE